MNRDVPSWILLRCFAKWCVLQSDNITWHIEAGSLWWLLHKHALISLASIVSPMFLTNTRELVRDFHNIYYFYRTIFHIHQAKENLTTSSLSLVQNKSFFRKKWQTCNRSFFLSVLTDPSRIYSQEHISAIGIRDLMHWWHHRYVPDINIYL